MPVNRAVYIPLYMNGTPFFPHWRPRLAALGTRLPETRQAVEAFTLAQLEQRFAPVVPGNLFPKAGAAVNSTPAIPAAQSHAPPQRAPHAADRIMSLL